MVKAILLLNAGCKDEKREIKRISMSRTANELTFDEVCFVESFAGEFRREQAVK